MLSEKCNAFSRPLKKKTFKEARGTTIGLYAIGTSTPLESNKSLRAIRFPKLRTAGVEAATNLEGEPHNSLQGREGAIVMVSGPHRSATAGAVPDKRQHGLRRRGCGTGCSTSHRHHLQAPVLPMGSV